MTQVKSYCQKNSTNIVAILFQLYLEQNKDLEQLLLVSALAAQEFFGGALRTPV